MNALIYFTINYLSPALYLLNMVVKFCQHDGSINVGYSDWNELEFHYLSSKSEHLIFVFSPSRSSAVSPGNKNEDKFELTPKKETMKCRSTSKLCAFNSYSSFTNCHLKSACSVAVYSARSNFENHECKRAATWNFHIAWNLVSLCCVTFRRIVVRTYCLYILNKF